MCNGKKHPQKLKKSEIVQYKGAQIGGSCITQTQEMPGPGRESSAPAEAAPLRESTVPSRMPSQMPTSNDESMHDADSGNSGDNPER